MVPICFAEKSAENPRASFTLKYKVSENQFGEPNNHFDVKRLGCVATKNGPFVGGLPKSTKMSLHDLVYIDIGQKEFRP